MVVAACFVGTDIYATTVYGDIGRLWWNLFVHITSASVGYMFMLAIGFNNSVIYSSTLGEPLVWFYLCLWIIITLDHILIPSHIYTNTIHHTITLVFIFIAETYGLRGTLGTALLLNDTIDILWDIYNIVRYYKYARCARALRYILFVGLVWLRLYEFNYRLMYLQVNVYLSEHLPWGMYVLYYCLMISLASVHVYWILKLMQRILRREY
jgi:hypothetical protein